MTRRVRGLLFVDVRMIRGHKAIERFGLGIVREVGSRRTIIAVQWGEG